MRLMVSSIALTAALALGGAAQAQDWSGFYVGAGVTQATGTSDASVALGGAWTTETAALRNGVTDNWSTELEPDGTGGSLFAGYNWQTTGGLVFGGELSYDLVGADADRETGQIVASSSFPALTYNFENSVEVDSVLAARAKLGYAFDAMLIYATAGYASADTTMGAAVLSNGAYSKIGEGSDSMSGMSYGLGAAFQVGGNWSVSGQWTRTDFGDQSFDTTYRAGSSFTSPAYNETFTQDLSLDVWRLGIARRF